jgi:hypothetical protein
MKGIGLPIETIVILVLAVLVLGVLLWFFTTSSSPAIQLVKLKQDQATWCASYQQSNPKCDEEGDSGVDEDIKDNLVDICSKLNAKEGGYGSCTVGLDPDASNANSCFTQCCRMYCGEPAESTTTIVSATTTT